ncbi:MAG: Crp/Fnr family transcriptional regulator [Microthrixaceae bacterium]
MSKFADEIAGLPLFSACSKRDLQRLSRATDELPVAAGTDLTVEGSIGREAFVIISGTADVTKDGEVVAQLGPGDHFGELALLDGGLRTATVTAREDMLVLVLSKPAFNGVLDEIPTLAHKLLVSLARRLRATEDSIGH